MWSACAQRGQQLSDHVLLVFQEAIFNKSTGKVVLKTFSLYKKLLTLSRAGHDQGQAWGVTRTWGMVGVRRLVTPSWTEGSECLMCDGGDWA